MNNEKSRLSFVTQRGHIPASARRPAPAATWLGRLRALLVGLALAVVPMAAASSGSIFLNAETVDTASPQAQATRQAVGSFSGKRLHLVQFTGPIKPQYLADLSSDGLVLVNYIPDNAYLVWGDAAALTRMQTRARLAQSAVQWDGPWKDEYKVHPDVFADRKSDGQPIASRKAEGDRYIVQLVADFTENAATMRELAGLGGSVFADPGALPGLANRHVKLPPASLALFAMRPDIISIHPFIEPTQNDERQSIIVAGNLVGNGPAPGNYLTQLSTWGFNLSQFTSSGIVVDVTDDGADINPGGAAAPPINSVSGPVAANHFVLFVNGDRPIGAAVPVGTSRYVYKGLFGTPGIDSGLGNSGHGQLNMSIIGGYVPTGTMGGVNFAAFPHADASGYRYGLGIAPFVRMGNSVIFDPTFTNPAYPTLISAAYGANARISSNSWGANTSGGYNASSQTYDGLVRDAQGGVGGNQPMVIVFSAGNAGPGGQTIGAPGTGKNVITVGAAEGVQAFGGADGCGITDAGADNANEMISFSSRGPAADGRKKPDIVAPGTHISGMAFVTPTSAGNATAVATFRGDGVCGGVGAVPFPAGQNWYTASSGTSHSAPAVAGGAALVFQQFLNNPSYLSANRMPASGAPSPALVKAYLMNSTRFMTGIAGDNLWSSAQGMGMINLGTAFDGVSRAIRDQVAADRFTASGQVRQFSGTTADPTKPFRVTLAWTDVPGATAGNAYVNNLDLLVVAGGTMYRGNVFSGAASVAGGAADPRNNVESVFLPAGITDFTVIVTGTNIAGQADPTVVGVNQDFALVAYNSGPLTVSTGAVLASGALTVTSGNGIVEPLECNNFNAVLQNVGAGGATALSSVITSSTPGAVITQGSSAYPNIASLGNASNGTPFQLSTSNAIACGTQINLTNTVTFTGGMSPVAIPFSVLVGQPKAANYAFASSSGTIPAGGAVLAGSQDDDALVTFAAPFTFSIYDTVVSAGTNIRLSTNGNIQFTPSGGNAAFANTALPGSVLGNVPGVLPYWDDLDLSGGNNGIFSDVTGVAPNRTLKLEWKGIRYNVPADVVNFAVFFHENSDAFEFVYNNAATASGGSATVGVQASGTGSVFTQFSFNTGGVITPGLKLSATRAPAICNTGPAQCTVAPPTMTSANNTAFTIGTPGSFVMNATGIPTPAIAAVGALPLGVTYNPATKTLAGTPAAGTAGVYPLTVTASNGVPPNANQSFALTVNAPPPPTNGYAPGTTFVTSSSNASPTIVATMNAVCPANGQLIVTATGESGAKSNFAGNAFIGLAFSIARDSTATDNANVLQSSALATFNGDANRDFLNVQRVDACTPSQAYTYALTAYATTPQTSTYIGSFVYNARMTLSGGPADTSIMAGTKFVTSASNPVPTIVTSLPVVCPANGTVFVAGSGESASVSNVAGTAFIGLAYSIARDSTLTDNANVVQSSSLSRFNGDANRDFLSVARRDTCTPGQTNTYHLTAYATTTETSLVSSFVWNGRLTALKLPTSTNFVSGQQFVTNSTNPAPTLLNTLAVVCPASGTALVSASGESAAISNFAGNAFIGLAYSLARNGTVTDNTNVVQSSALAAFNGDANRDFLSLQRVDSCTPGATDTYWLTVYPTTAQTGAATQSFMWNGRLTAIVP
jgi:hypothetical protein